MEEMLPRSLEETKVAWEEGLKRAIRRGMDSDGNLFFL